MERSQGPWWPHGRPATKWECSHELLRSWVIQSWYTNHKDVGLSVTATAITLTYNQVFYHQLDGHEFEQALGVSDGQGSLACCSPWGHKESDTTERLNWLMTLEKYVSKTCYPRQLWRPPYLDVNQIDRKDQRLQNQTNEIKLWFWIS